MNIALVVLDTLRKDYFDSYFDWLPGRRYDNAWSTSHWTVPAHTALFSGMYSAEVGNHRGDLSIPSDVNLIQERLSEEGYTCRGYTANPLISQKFDFDRGFDRLTGNLRYRLSQEDMFDWVEFLHEADEEGLVRNLLGLRRCFEGPYDFVDSLKAGIELKFTDSWLPVGTSDMGGSEALDHIQSIDFGKDEFLFLNLMEAHYPHTRPEAHRTVDSFDTPDHPLFFVSERSPFDEERARLVYEESVEYLSDIYRDIFSVLDENFDYIITVSDHGELLGEYGMYGHRYGVYPELVNVPLVITGGGQSGQTDGRASLLDIHATIAAIAGLDIDSRGQNLLDDVGPTSYLTNYYGIQIKRKEKLESLAVSGHSDEEIRELDNQRHGLCLKDGGYFYEGREGTREWGPVVSDDPEEELRLAMEGVEERLTEESESMEESMRSQLEHLGYID